MTLLRRICIKDARPKSWKLGSSLDKAIADPRWIEYTDQFLLVRVDYSGEEAIDYLKKWTSRAAWLLYDFGAAENSPEEFGIPRLEE